MRFIATIQPPLLSALGSKENSERKLEELLERVFWSTTHPINREENIKVTLLSPSLVNICMDLNQRDAEIVKDMIHEAMLNYLRPEYNSDINVEINTEL